MKAERDHHLTAVDKCSGNSRHGKPLHGHFNSIRNIVGGSHDENNMQQQLESLKVKTGCVKSNLTFPFTVIGRFMMQ